jgi:hypothetical protein
MTKYVHIVQVHPVELGKPNLSKVKAEREFATVELANAFVKYYNHLGAQLRRDYGAKHVPNQKAVYYGCVNDATGELV